MPSETAPLVALFTDFGTDDPWVAELKASLWSIQPAFRIVDVTHTIPPHDLQAGAFAIYRTYRSLPPWTINLCVVDPGVGGPRRPILVVIEDRYFVGPDNGLFSYIYQYEPVARVIHITSEHYFNRPVSQTFQARDIFAPIAAWLSKGIDSQKFGDLVDDPVKIAVPLDRAVGDSLVKGEVCAVDRFGNLITNIRQATLEEITARTGKGRFKVLVAGHELPFVTEGGYAQEAPLFALINSAGLLEVAGAQRSAAEALQVGRGKDVGLMAE
jgi:S-adenosylmethionine hydrolase